MSRIPVSVHEYVLQRRAFGMELHKGNTKQSANVPCGSCTACCTGYDVELDPTDSGEGLNYDTDERGVRTLKRQSNGDCGHLVQGRCGVYELRPLPCRSYDCRAMLIAHVAPKSHAAVAEALRTKWHIALIAHEDYVTRDRVVKIAHFLVNNGVKVEQAAELAILLFPESEKRLNEMLGHILMTQKNRDITPLERKVMHGVE